MTIKEVKSLKRGDLVLCTRTSTSIIGSKNVSFIKGKIYKIGGSAWPSKKFMIDNHSEEDLENKCRENFIAVEKDELGSTTNAWNHEYFVKFTNQEVAKVLYGEK